MGLKPIESGIIMARDERSAPAGSDASLLAAAGSLRTGLPHPIYALPDPVSPHLAARSAGVLIDIDRVAAWATEAEAQAAPHIMPRSALWTVIETAGGVFSPLGQTITNFELAQKLEPAVWVLVAADSLGVLHDVSSTLKAMRASGRAPNHLVLSGAREPDASSGGNAAELTSLGIATPSAVLARNDDFGVDALLERLLDDARRPLSC
jgi:dethiobiotin synthetase